MESPFEPLTELSLYHLTLKKVFLAAITSTRRVSDLQTLMSEPCYSTLHRDKVVLRPHLKFIPKVVSELHLKQSTYLRIVFPNHAALGKGNYAH